MSGSQGFDSAQALAVVMGNSRWEAAAYEDNAACRSSAEAMHAYVLDSNGLGMDDANVLAVIDDESPYPGQILERIHDFLTERKEALQAEQRPVRDLLFYYVGHGSFSESKDYFLPIFKTRGPDFEGTSIRLDALAKIVKATGRNLRCHMIFDACFSAATFQAFLSSGPADVAVQKTLHAFPSSGIALLCSAGRSDPALAPEGLRDTMFTGELLRILKEGDRTGPDRLSFGDLAELISERLKKRFTDVIRPHVSSPRQKDGQVHVLPLFPNVLAGAAPPASTGTDDAGKSTAEAGPSAGGDQAADEGLVKGKEPVRIRVWQYTLTDAEWSKVPKEVQTLLLSWQEETFIGYGMMALSVVCLMMAGVAAWVGPIAADASMSVRIVGIVLGMSGGAAVLLFTASVYLFMSRRWRPKVPELGPKSSRPRAWEEFEIMDGLRERDGVYLLGNSSISRRALTGTLLLTLAALVVWIGNNLLR